MKSPAKLWVPSKQWLLGGKTQQQGVLRFVHDRHTQTDIVHKQDCRNQIVGDVGVQQRRGAPSGGARRPICSVSGDKVDPVGKKKSKKTLTEWGGKKNRT